MTLAFNVDVTDEEAVKMGDVNEDERRESKEDGCVSGLEP